MMIQREENMIYGYRNKVKKKVLDFCCILEF